MGNWICKCGKECKGKFCPQCGNKRPENIESADTASAENTLPDENTVWCSHCGARNSADPAGGKYVKCCKCGLSVYYFGIFDLDYLKASTPTIARLNIEKLADLKTGDEFSFGRIAEKQLKWRVIETDEGKIEAICLPDRYLTELPFNEEYVQTTWKTSSLRKFLNEEFTYAAFSEEERSRLISTNVTNDDNSRFGTSGGDPTEDKVFILSEQEVSRLIPDGFIKKKNMWLRTPGYSHYAASFYGKELDVIGEQVNKKGGIMGSMNTPVVYPVIWIDTTGIPSYERKAASETASDLKKGGEIEFGFDPHRGSIKWKVLEVKDDRALIISKGILREMVFDEKPEDSNYVPLWENSILRKWLNEDFLNSYFTDEEKKRVLVTNNPNNNLTKYDKSVVEAHATDDKVFLLSKDEAASYFPKDEDRCCEGCLWLLRTTNPYFAVAVGYKGEISENNNCQPDDYCGIRPAMWISCG